jgi:UDP-glucose 4-epimerase
MLSSQGRHEVLATDAVTTQKSDALAGLARVEFRAMDLRDQDRLSEAVRSVHAVAHLAAMRLKASDSQPREGFSVNVAATFDLLTAASEHGIRAFVYGSSQQLYGSFSSEPDSPVLEEDGAVGRDVSMYAAAKLACEAFLPPFASRGGFGYLALRFGSIYGPDAAEHSNSWMMLEALRAVDRGEKPRVSWSRDSRHSLVYVDDAARAVVRAIDLPLRNAAVNVVGEAASTGEIYSTLLRLYGANPQDVEFTPDRRRYQLVDNKRLRTSFGCPPETGLEAGLQAIVNWHNASG